MPHGRTIPEDETGIPTSPQVTTPPNLFTTVILSILARTVGEKPAVYEL